MLNLNYNIQLKDIFIYNINETSQLHEVEIYLNEDINKNHLIFNDIWKDDITLGSLNRFFNSNYYGYCFDFFRPLMDDYDNYAVYQENIRKVLERVYLHYQNSNICYTNIQQFLVDFKYKISMNLPSLILKQYILFDKIYKLKESDIIEREHAININALNDNSKIEKPLDNLAEFVSEQTASKISKNKLTAYTDYLKQVRPSIENELIKELKPLFFTIIPEYNYIYKGEY